MISDDVMRMLQDALSAMENARSSRFTETMTFGSALPEPEDLTAEGVTDFVHRQTRMRHRLGARALEKGLKYEGKSLVLRLATRAVARLFRSQSDFRDRFCDRGSTYEYDPDRGKWRQVSRRSEAVGVRPDADPVVALDFLTGAIRESLRLSGDSLNGLAATRIDGQVDFRIVADRLPRDLRSYSRSRSRPHFRAMPISVWLDEEARIRRLRYRIGDWKPEPLWKALEFFDFGAVLNKPPI